MIKRNPQYKVDPIFINRLSPELQERETLSDRKKIEEFVFEGEFRGKK